MPKKQKEILKLVMHDVISSNISKVGHDGDSLHVKFKNGAIWQYKKVPMNVYDEMMASDSLGHYFSKVIKPKYKAVQHVTEEKDAQL